MKILISKPAEKIILLLFENAYSAGSTMIRLQEFYESPHAELRGQWFELETAMDVLVNNYGKFTYFEDWCGYNVPDFAVLNFFDLYAGTLREKEKILYSTLLPLIRQYRYTGMETQPKPRAFSVIGAVINDKQTIRHELAHAFYYLFDDYTSKMLQMTYEWSKAAQLRTKLVDAGYSTDFADDEIQAYCATSTIDYMKKLFKLSLPNPNGFKRFFNVTKGKYLLDEGNQLI